MSTLLQAVEAVEEDMRHQLEEVIGPRQLVARMFKQKADFMLAVHNQHTELISAFTRHQGRLASAIAREKGLS